MGSASVRMNIELVEIIETQKETVTTFLNDILLAKYKWTYNTKKSIGDARPEFFQAELLQTIPTLAKNDRAVCACRFE